jgi:hypothetical protein
MTPTSPSWSCPACARTRCASSSPAASCSSGVSPAAPAPGCPAGRAAPVGGLGPYRGHQPGQHADSRQQHPLPPQPRHRLAEQRHRPLGMRPRPPRPGTRATARSPPRRRSPGTRTPHGSPRHAHRQSSAGRWNASPPRDRRSPADPPDSRPRPTAHPADRATRTCPETGSCPAVPRTPAANAHHGAARPGHGQRRQERRTAPAPPATALPRTARTRQPAHRSGTRPPHPDHRPATASALALIPARFFLAHGYGGHSRSWRRCQDSSACTGGAVTT